MTTTIRLGRRQLTRFGSAAAIVFAVLPRGMSPASASRQTPIADSTAATPNASPDRENAGHRVRFAVGNNEIIVDLADNPTSRDFESMLPLALDFEDFADMEKISYLPRELVTEGSIGRPPRNGDLIYFTPWGNLGFFYDADRRDKSYDDRVIPIGTIEAGAELLANLETGPVHVEFAK